MNICHYHQEPDDECGCGESRCKCGLTFQYLSGQRYCPECEFNAFIEMCDDVNYHQHDDDAEKRENENKGS